MDVGKPAARVGMVSIPRERPRALEVRTAEHFEHQIKIGPFFGAQADAHGADATSLSLSGATDGTSSLREDFAHNPKRVAHVTVRAT